jgi:hypothetical protein
MTPLDIPLVSAGWLAHAVEQRTGGSRRALRGVVLGLVALSAIPTIIIGSSQRPTDLTFEDVRLDRIPAMTTWVRLEGELRPLEGARGFLYELHAPLDDRLYVIVIAEGPLELGHAVVTGRLSPGAATTGNIGSIEADIPAVPKRNEPFGLILLPAALGLVVVIGTRLGYPVVRRDGRPVSAEGSLPLAPAQRVSARWSGRVGSEGVRLAERIPCTITVSAGPDVSDLAIEDARGTRTIRVRRAAPMRRVRLCRITGSEPALEIYAQTADLTLAFDDRVTRDRLATTLR